MQIPLDHIRYDETFNTRGFFTDESVRELAESIKASGLIQPVILRDWRATTDNDPPYHLVCGHRRFKAVQLLGWTEIKAEVYHNLSDRDASILNLQENLARVNLSPSQEMASIIHVYGESPNAALVAKELGRSKKWVNERLAIRRLHPEVRAYVDQGLLTAWDISMLLPMPATEQHIAATQLVQAHAKGKSSQSVFTKLGRRRWVRTKKEIQTKLTELMDLGIEPPGWRCLAWAAATITDEELLIIPKKAKKK
jgi:ParB family chromosome partitioning protein